MELTTADGRRLVWRTLAYDRDDRDGEWSHSGAAIAADGRLVVAQRGGSGISLIDVESGRAERIATPTSDCHGILSAPSLEPNTLWIADPGGQVLVLDLASRATRSIKRPARVDEQTTSWAPTSVAVVTSGLHRGDLWIADGYGESLVHVIRADGSTLTIDGSATGLAFDCPHGIAVDTRRSSALIVIADRNNRRLVWLDLNGDLVRVLDNPLLTSPSSIAVRADQLLITDLFGALLAVDPDDTVIELVPIDPATHDRPGWPNSTVTSTEAIRPPLVEGILNSPHGIAVDERGTVYLSEWVIGGREIAIDLDDDVARTSAAR